MTVVQLRRGLRRVQLKGQGGGEGVEVESSCEEYRLCVDVVWLLS